MSKEPREETDAEKEKIEQDIRIDSNKSLNDAEAKLADPNISPSEKARLERQLSEAKANLLAKAQEIEKEKTVEAKQEKTVAETEQKLKEVEEKKEEAKKELSSDAKVKPEEVTHDQKSQATVPEAVRLTAPVVKTAPAQIAPDSTPTAAKTIVSGKTM